MEVGLAATVLALTLVGMIGVVESGTQMLDLSRKQTMAAQILHGEIDQLRLQTWMAIAGEPPGGPAALSSTFYSSTQVGRARFSDDAFNPRERLPRGPHDSHDDERPVFRGGRPHLSPSADNLHVDANGGLRRARPKQSESNGIWEHPLLLQVTFTIKWTGITGRSYSRSSTLVGQNGLSVAYQRS